MVDVANGTAPEKNGAAKPKETKTRAEMGTREKIHRKVSVRGLTDIMFARYAGDNDTKLEPWQKLYLGGETGRTICLPSANLMSFLSAQNTDSAPKRLLDPRKYKRFAQACGSYVMIGPDMIPITREGKPVEFGRLDSKRPDGTLCDSLSGVYIRHDVARLDKGIPNPVARPVLPLPWELSFTLTVWPNKEIQEQQLLNIFTEGLIAIGLGTWRGRFGKAEVVLWE